LECLKEAIEEFKNFTFSQLKTASHDSAYNSADEDNCISFEDIAAAGGADPRKIGFVQNWLENENFSAR
jgi:hypothetical protein